MERVEAGFGRANRDAPVELSEFAFLIGSWRGKAMLRGDRGEWQSFEASWIGRFILDGYVIADEYRMTS